LAVAVLGVYRFSYFFTAKKGAGLGANTAPLSVPAPVSGTVQPSLPIRLMVGYNGKPQVDSAGETWSAVKYFYSGGT
jgi:hypothetical protein